MKKKMQLPAKKVKFLLQIALKAFKQKILLIIFSLLISCAILFIFINRIGIKTPFHNAKIEGVVYAHDSIRALSGIKVILNNGEQTVRTDSEGKFYFPKLNLGKHKIEVISDLYQTQIINQKAKLGKINKDDLLDITLKLKKFPSDQYLIITKSPSAYMDKTLAIIDLQGNELSTLGNGQNPKLKDQYTLQFDNRGSNYEIFLDGSGLTRMGSIGKQNYQEESKTNINASNYSSDNKYYFESEKILMTDSKEIIFADNIFGSILFSWIPNSHKLIAQYNNYDRNNDEIYLLDLDKNNEKKLITTIPNNSYFYLSENKLIWSPDRSSFIEDYFLINLQDKQAIPLPKYSDYYYLNPQKILVSTGVISNYAEGLYIFDNQGNELQKIGDKKVDLNKIQFNSDKSKFIISDGYKLYIYDLENASNQIISDEKFNITNEIWLN